MYHIDANIKIEDDNMNRLRMHTPNIIIILVYMSILLLYIHPSAIICFSCLIVVLSLERMNALISVVDVTYHVK